MARPVVLVAFDPQEPEEANAVDEVLADVAEVLWLHELGQPLKDVQRDDVDVIMCFHWPDGLVEAVGRMTRLRLIQRVPAGVEGFPFDGLADAIDGVRLASGSGSNAAWVAEHAFGLLLACAKRIPWHDREMRDGRFHQTDVMSQELDGATLGIVGYGEIGRRVADLARAFRMRVVALRSRSRDDDPQDVLGGLDRLDDLLSSSDFVLLSLPLTPATQGLIGARELQIMRSGASLVNVSRGGIVDAKALHDHLSLHPDFFAGLDVWWDYPKGGDFRQPYGIEKLPNLVMTPHNAAMVPRWRERMVRSAAENVRRFLETGEVGGQVRPADYARQVTRS